MSRREGPETGFSTPGGEQSAELRRTCGFG